MAPRKSNENDSYFSPTEMARMANFAASHSGLGLPDRLDDHAGEVVNGKTVFD